MGKSPAFQMYPADWLSSEKVMLMTPAQEGAYVRLLLIAWGNDDCGLPDDDEQLAVLSRLGEGWLNGGSTLVRKCFFSEGGRLFNKRLLEEREKQRVWREKSAAGGKKSGKVRRAKKLAIAKGGCQMVATKREPNTNTSSSTPSIKKKKSKKKKIEPTPQQLEWFEPFWKVYPRHADRTVAFPKFCEVVKTPEVFEQVMAAAQNYRDKVVVQEREQQHIKHGATWLNHWTDSLEDDADPLADHEARKAKEKQEREFNNVLCVVCGEPLGTDMGYRHPSGGSAHTTTGPDGCYMAEAKFNADGTAIENPGG